MYRKLSREYRKCAMEKLECYPASAKRYAPLNELYSTKWKLHLSLARERCEVAIQIQPSNRVTSRSVIADSSHGVMRHFNGRIAGKRGNYALISRYLNTCTNKPENSGVTHASWETMLQPNVICYSPLLDTADRRSLTVADVHCDPGTQRKSEMPSFVPFNRINIHFSR